MSPRFKRWTFPRIKSHIFNGHRFDFIWRTPRIPGKEARRQKKLGLALYGRTHGEAPGRKIFISMDRELHRDEYDLFSTLLHESSHASFPQLDEESVLAFEQNFVCLLRRMKMKLVLPCE
jgi:hypothetical protein